jgi:3-methyl-2-oxobutanoate hydroxymethyltransferase
MKVSAPTMGTPRNTSLYGSAGEKPKARVTIDQIRKMKERGERIVMLTAYDSSMAALVEAAGVPMILVGDSMGNVMLGFDSTLPVTLEDIRRHTAAVVRGTKTALIVADMPFLSFQISPAEALRNAGMLLKETGCQAVKLEGGAHMAETVATLVRSGIPVMGHLGMTPQSFNAFGGFKVQGKTEHAALQLIEDAKALEQAGAFAIVLELVPQEVAEVVSQRIAIPTIGIGAGIGCDGEVQVLHDILGLQPNFTPRHAQRFAEIGSTIVQAVSDYAQAVRERRFPTEQNSSRLKPDVLARLREELGDQA